MSFNGVNRKYHYWAAFAVSVPLLVIVSSGILLQMKKQVRFVQPAEQRGTGTVPAVTLDSILGTVKGASHLGVTSWDDIDRLDVRPSKGMVKVLLKSRWEAQVDLSNGALLQTAYRRSDLIESFHDGSFFAGDWTKLGLFLPTGVVLATLWLTGLWMWWVTWKAKRKKKKAAAT